MTEKYEFHAESKHLMIKNENGHPDGTENAKEIINHIKQAFYAAQGIDPDQSKQRLQ